VQCFNRILKKLTSILHHSSTIAMINDQQGAPWSMDDEDKMIAVLAQTKMSSKDCDITLSHMFGRSVNAIHMRRLLIAQRLMRDGHNIVYVAKLMHFSENEVLQYFKQAPATSVSTPTPTARPSNINFKCANVHIRCHNMCECDHMKSC
jgi:hypothetical protein